MKEQLPEITAIGAIEIQGYRRPQVYRRIRRTRLQCVLGIPTQQFVDRNFQAFNQVLAEQRVQAHAADLKTAVVKR
ncbi:hypothetical protein D3C77_656780 [compost metagenome]